MPPDGRIPVGSREILYNKDQYVLTGPLRG